MTTLADTARRLDIAWQRSLRRDPPRQRWAAHHPSLRGDPHDLRQRLTARDEASREPLRALVELAIAGDNAAALLVTLALLPRMVAVERRQRPWLREDIERRAWRGLYRGHTRSAERHHLNPDSPRLTAEADFSGDVASRVTIERALDQLTRDRWLNPARRRILERIAAGTNQPYRRCLRQLPGVDAERRRRDRTIARMRSCTALLDALAA
jgi:hypothetical protein